MNEKYCPLLLLVNKAEIRGKSTCLESDCAFWNDDMQACSIKALGRMATYWMLNDSRDRMTPEERKLSGGEK